jgi:hypothetical protein
MPALGQKWFYKTCAGGSRKLATDAVVSDSRIHEHEFSQIRLQQRQLWSFSGSNRCFICVDGFG